MSSQLKISEEKVVVAHRTEIVDNGDRDYQVKLDAERESEREEKLYNERVDKFEHGEARRAEVIP